MSYKFLENVKKLTPTTILFGLVNLLIFSIYLSTLNSTLQLWSTITGTILLDIAFAILVWDTFWPRANKTDKNKNEWEETVPERDLRWIIIIIAIGGILIVPIPYWIIPLF